MNVWTKAVFQQLLEDPESLRETCLLWLTEFPRDSTKAAIEFAGQLAEDFKTERFVNSPLVNAFLDAGYSRVNWRRLPDELLARFRPAKHRELVSLPSAN